MSGKIKTKAILRINAKYFSISFNKILRLQLVATFAWDDVPQGAGAIFYAPQDQIPTTVKDRLAGRYCHVYSLVETFDGRVLPYGLLLFLEKPRGIIGPC